MMSRPDSDALLEEEVLTDQATEASSAALESTAVSRLAELFPEHARTELEGAVAAHPGNLDAAASLLASGHVEDEDERLARAIQAAETRRMRPSTRGMEHVVDVLRDIVVPAVHTHFKELSFDDVSEESGAVRYSLRQVRVVALSLPTDNIVVRTVSSSRVRVQLVNMFLQIAVGRWRYESTGFLSWADAGTLEASINGLGAVADLAVAQSVAGAVQLSVRTCEVEVEGSVKIRTQGTAADWAYNTVAAVCKPLIVSYVKDTIARQLRDTLTVELANWNSEEPRAQQTQQPSSDTTLTS